VAGGIIRWPQRFSGGIHSVPVLHIILSNLSRKATSTFSS
jgi:hypothetical protein